MSTARPQCPVTACQNRLPRGAFMCGRCWKALPEDVRRQVEVDFEELKAARRALGRDAGDQARAMLALRASRETVDRAIDAAGFARRDWPIPPLLRGRTFVAGAAA